MSTDPTLKAALKTLKGHDAEAVIDTLDTLLGLAIVAVPAATGPAGLPALSLLGAKSALCRAGKKALSHATAKARDSGPRQRDEYLVSAHTIAVLASFFDAFDKEIPNSKAYKLTPSEKYQLADKANRPSSAEAFLLNARAPFPLEPDSIALLDKKVTQFYESLADRLIRHLEGLAEWERLTAAKREDYRARIKRLPTTALGIYNANLRTLAENVPDFRLWIEFNEARSATVERSQIAGGLGQLHDLLQRLVRGSSTPDIGGELRALYEDRLQAPILGDLRAAEHATRIPTLVNSYVTPDYKNIVAANADISSERTWKSIRRRNDIDSFIAAQLALPAANTLPLVVLGHPGAGKSLLTYFLATGLPSESYTALRVDLRRVPADASIIAQIEYQIRETGRSMDWAEFYEAIAPTCALIVFDGLDELLQATNESSADYLERVEEFQRQQRSQGRPVQTIVTSRTVVMSRVRVPDNCTVIKLEPFSYTQVAKWAATWNAANQNVDTWRELDANALMRLDDLATQPLLLTLLALHNGDGGQLDYSGDRVEQLYSDLVDNFLTREVRKLAPGLPPDEELQKIRVLRTSLALVAFSMFNRGQQYVSMADLEADWRSYSATSLNVLESGPKTLLSKFFFVHESRTKLGVEELKSTYEFLHATFGEYLVAWLIRQLATSGMASVQQSRHDVVDAGRDHGTAGLLVGLIAGGCFADREQVLLFVRGLFRDVDTESVSDLNAFLASAMARVLSGNWTVTGYSVGHMPLILATASANLVLIAIAASRADSHYNVGELLPGRQGTSAKDKWRRLSRLWRSQLEEHTWNAIINQIDIEDVCDESIALRFQLESPPSDALGRLQRTNDLELSFVQDRVLSLVEAVESLHRGIGSLAIEGSSNDVALVETALAATDVLARGESEGDRVEKLMRLLRSLDLSAFESARDRHDAARARCVQEIVQAERVVVLHKALDASESMAFLQHVMRYLPKEPDVPFFVSAIGLCARAADALEEESGEGDVATQEDDIGRGRLSAYVEDLVARLDYTHATDRYAAELLDAAASVGMSRLGVHLVGELLELAYSYGNAGLTSAEAAEQCVILASLQGEIAPRITSLDSATAILSHTRRLAYIPPGAALWVLNRMAVALGARGYGTFTILQPNGIDVDRLQQAVASDRIVAGVDEVGLTDLLWNLGLIELVDDTP